MYQRTRTKVERSTRVPAQAPPSRPEHTYLARSESQQPGAEDPEGQAMALEGVYIISVAARILDMHPQTLRKYERLGLIRRGRTLGMLRLYSAEDIRRVRLIRHLGNMGLNLAGVEFALATVENLLRLERRMLGLVEDREVGAAVKQEIGRVFRNLNLPMDD